jgi:predicted enzyme related to lactoylglutathione lyase
MPNVTIPTPGTFCWADLQTTDPPAAERFYSAVLGWTIAPVPDNTPYSVASLDGRMTAGVKALPARARGLGAPPHWLSYVAVDDVQTSVDKAVTLGAAVLLPPTTTGPGTFAVLRDPTGAAFAIWHSPVSMGTTLYGEHGGVGWNELVSTDPAAAREFYTSLFGWTVENANMPGLDYSILKNRGVAIAGLMKLPAEAAGTPSYWCVYFVADDVDEAFDIALAGGATAIMPLTDVPTVGRFGFLTDPQGAMFALIQFEGEAG